MCHEPLLSTSFVKDRRSRDGLSIDCKACRHLAYMKNRLTIIERQKKYDQEHKEQIRAYHLVYNFIHRNEKLLYNKKYYEEHREALVEYARAYRIANPEKRRISWNAWYKKHPDPHRASQARRRANKKNAPRNDLTTAQWEAIKIAFNNRCAYCGRKMKRLTQDHVTPYANGGSNTLWNVVPACKSCNSKKYTGPPLCPVQPLLLI